MDQKPNFRPTITLVSEDARGEIYVVNLPNDRELVLLHSKSGTLRGGHSHDVPETNVLLMGRMKYHKLSPAGIDTTFTLGDGDTSVNDVGEVHMGEFLDDSWMIEWKRCANKNSWKNQNYAPWREKVESHARH